MAEHLAWAAGFYDGEGHFRINQGCPTVRINQVGREVLDRFAAAVGVGKVLGPYWSYRGGLRFARSVFSYSACGADALTVVRQLYPLLSGPKRAQIDGAQYLEAVPDERQLEFALDD